MASTPMTNETDILSEADEIAALLPWYVSGKISIADRARVDAYAKLHPDVREHIKIAREEADLVFAENSAIAPPRDALARLQQSIGSSPAHRLASAKASLLDRIGDWMAALQPRQLAFAGLAATVLLALQSLSIGSLLSQQQVGGYHTASGDKAATAAGAYALVAFQPAAPQSTLTAFLADNGFAIVDGPKSGGIYRIRLAGNALKQAELDAALGKLKARSDLVSFASAAPSTP